MGPYSAVHQWSIFHLYSHLYGWLLHDAACVVNLSAQECFLFVLDGIFARTLVLRLDPTSLMSLLSTSNRIVSRSPGAAARAAARHQRQVRKLAILPLLDPSWKPAPPGRLARPRQLTTVDASRSKTSAVGDISEVGQHGMMTCASIDDVGRRLVSRSKSDGAVATQRLWTASSPRSSRLSGSISPATIRNFSSSSPARPASDPSTIDFAFLPRDDDASPANEAIRVPLLPDTPVSPHSAMARPSNDVEPAVFRATISTAADVSTFPDPPSAISEIADGGSGQVDHFALAGTVGSPAANSGQNVPVHGDDEKGVFRQVWNGLVDDVFRPPRLDTT